MIFLIFCNFLKKGTIYPNNNTVKPLIYTAYRGAGVKCLCHLSARLCPAVLWTRTSLKNIPRDACFFTKFLAVFFPRVRDEKVFSFDLSRWIYARINCTNESSLTNVALFFPWPGCLIFHSDRFYLSRHSSHFFYFRSIDARERPFGTGWIWRELEIFEKMCFKHFKDQIYDNWYTKNYFEIFNCYVQFNLVPGE